MLRYGRNRAWIIMGYRVQRVEKIIERELASIIFSEVHNELIKFVSNIIGLKNTSYFLNMYMKIKK